MASTKSQLAPKALPRPTIWCPKAWRLIGIRALWHSVFLKFAILNPKSTNISAGDANSPSLPRYTRIWDTAWKVSPNRTWQVSSRDFSCATRSSARNGPTTSHWKLYFRSCDTNQTREMFSQYPDKVSSLSCGWLMGQWRITLQAIDLSPSRPYCNPPQVGVLPRRSVCHHMMRLPRRARRGQLRGNQ